MKAVIFFSGLAGFLLFGPPFLKSWNERPRETEVRVVVREVAKERVANPERARIQQSQCRFEAERILSSSVSGVDDFYVQAGSGSLEVVGVDGHESVQIVARACASSEEFLDDLQVTTELSGATLVVETHYPEMRGWSMGDRYASLDLRVEVPAGMAAEIHDGSGEVYITNVGPARVIDGSGELSVTGIRGDLTIEDGSGSMEIEDVSGNVSIQDGSGEVAVRGVGLDLDIQDSSGELEVRSVGGSVTLQDSSGEIDVEEVTGSVRVIRDSSGGIEVRGIGGDFLVERDGSGSIRYREVQGTVDIPPDKRDG
jgi:hypothetical protein